MKRSGAKGQRRVCFVTGTRAEFGLMRTALEAIREHPDLRLQIIVTGMHLDPAHGDGLAAVAREGFAVDAVVPWPAESGGSVAANAANTGAAMADLAIAMEKLKTDIVLVVGDRVEAFAAAAAGHLSRRVVAHVHGGDRAMGQTDDSLRHAITKLAHVHFPATKQSEQRIRRLGEEAYRIHRVGSPGNDRIVESAATWEQLQETFADLRRRDYAMVLLHPIEANAANEEQRARMVLEAVKKTGFGQAVVIYPNNDPGSAGIVRCWKRWAKGEKFIVRPNVPRGVFLGLLHEAAVLVGNSSSGIIEAASFGTPVVDIGPRQKGRERSRNVVHCEYEPQEIQRQLKRIWNSGRAKRIRCVNVYGGGGAGRRMADILARLDINAPLLTKLICY
ncbi:MAG TPA: UDP-N-acetylglucosamine 2-epimerase [Tepidisphaeraceae bacterium]|nr:UDP-N-acetylglucosamine 2-epimerase [Tepidisphaeraceae bacterium]